MTRMIDADALKKENERLLHCDFPYLSETTLEELIDEAPTIDAIPIKWIIRNRNKHINDGFAWIFEAVLDDWRKERDKAD